MRAALRPFAVLLAVAGCSPITPPPPPGPLPEPEFEVPHDPALPDPADVLAAPPMDDGRVDELLASPMLRDPDFQADVAEWLDYWTRLAAAWVPDFLSRMGTYEEGIDEAITDAGLPPSLRYLPFIESGYNPRATSHAAAVGMWQFMAPTARGYGLEVSRLLDERRDPVRSTEVAVGYLQALHAEFDSWFLALAAYNGGPTRTRRILRQHAPVAARSDSLFWALREHFPSETRQFVPKLVAAIAVAQRPHRYGIRAEPGQPFRYDEVEVPDATTLDVVARAALVELDDIEALNPALVRGITPPGRRYRLRVPEGQGEIFTLNYGRIPPEERVTFVEHVVSSGETLSHIAQRYGVAVGDLRAANPRVRDRYLQIGERLTVPVAPSVRGTG